MAAMVANGANFASLSPIGPTGIIVNGIMGRSPSGMRVYRVDLRRTAERDRNGERDQREGREIHVNLEVETRI
jgi:hypothetical protein